MYQEKELDGPTSLVEIYYWVVYSPRTNNFFEANNIKVDNILINFNFNLILIINCKFGELLDTQIRDIFVMGLGVDILKRKY